MKNVRCQWILACQIDIRTLTWRREPVCDVALWKLPLIRYAGIRVKRCRDRNDYMISGQSDAWLGNALLSSREKVQIRLDLGGALSHSGRFRFDRGEKPPGIGSICLLPAGCVWPSSLDCPWTVADGLAGVCWLATSSNTGRPAGRYSGPRNHAESRHDDTLVNSTRVD